MGKIFQGILGGVSSKVGSVVGASWKGIPTLRVYQPNVSNPKTAAQVQVRNSFSFLSVIASLSLAGFIKPLWDRDAVRMSGYNAFISANKALAGKPNNQILEGLTASKGKMQAPVITLQQSGNLPATGVAITASNGRYELPTDKIYCLVINSAGEVLRGGDTGTTRQTGGFTFKQVPAIEQGELNDECYVYVAALRADGTIVSNSVSAVAANGINASV